MKFRDLPVIFLSYMEDNAFENFQHLKRMVPHATRVMGVEGFDAAHRAAAKMARPMTIDMKEHPYFITVDADNRTMPGFWELDTDEMHHKRYPKNIGRENIVLSWNSYNPVTGLAYGNGGLKLWGYNFIDEMKTHEEATDTVVDFCWRPNYFQLHNIQSVTLINGSPDQAFTAGFREGVKMPLIGGLPGVSVYQTKEDAYQTNLERLITWCSVGQHAEHGEWSIMGALLGFARCHIRKDFDLKDVSNIHQIRSIYSGFDKSYNIVPAAIHDLRNEIARYTDIYIPLLGAKQSAFVVQRTLPTVQPETFELESWPPKIQIPQ